MNSRPRRKPAVDPEVTAYFARVRAEREAGQSAPNPVSFSTPTRLAKTPQQRESKQLTLEQLARKLVLGYWPGMVFSKTVGEKGLRVGFYHYTRL